MRPLAFALSIAVPVAGLFAQPMAMPIDVSKLIVGAPATVTELDLGTLKGELRQVGWSSDDTQLYVQTADGDPQSPKLRHYTVPRAGGVPAAVDAQPDWAHVYWTNKSDRTAPGVPALVIDVEQKLETVKIGTGSAGAIDSNRSDPTGVSPGNIDRESQRQKQNVVRFNLLGQAVSEFVNERPIPGLMFGWGPRGTGVIAYTDRDGRLMLLDQEQHKRIIPGVKQALLPAWSTDASRLAWVQKSGRKKFTLLVAGVSKS
ncbi:MAG: hypothetical protein LAO77_13985 [Acidobacteriia bacterium]|nr:hypothetical protein [Terriglobia bacterium]